MWRQATGPVIALAAVLWLFSPAQARGVYVVRAGDTLWRISHHLGVRPIDLAAANHIELTDRIHPGLRLAVPGVVPTTAAPVREVLVGQLTSSRGTLGREPIPQRASVTDQSRASFSSRASMFSSAAVRIAMGLLGRPYQWSGTGFRGFDCSGFITHVFAAAGRQLPHSSFAQYEAGIGVSRLALAPGDLVFFRTYGPGASHVGLYIGESRFVHASYSRGVVISSFEEPYFRDRFVGARRL